MSNIDIDKLKRFESRLGAYIKQMLSDGWYPGTFLFPLGKINGMMQISEELDFPLKFERDIYVRTAFKLRNIPLFKNYKFLVTLNKISQLKRYFKRYIIMDGHKFDVHPSSKMMDIVNDYIAVKAKGITWEPETTRLVKELVKPGMTLCKKCHINTETYGNKKN